MNPCIFLSTFLFIVALLASSSHALTCESYWRKTLPNASIPKAILELNGQMIRPMTLLGKDISNNIYHKYNNDIPQSHIPIDHALTLFIREKDLKPGSKFELWFIETTSGPLFTLHSQADKLPFASNKLSEILTRFQVEPRSAETIRRILVLCETPATKGEDKFCATSLESMVEFSIMSLGTKDVQASSTTILNGDAKVKKSYSIAKGGVRALRGEKLVGCHVQPYLYRVFYCHVSEKSRAYNVSLESVDGTKIESVVVCHFNTTKWDPEHVAFQVLKVKPGNHVCHFMATEDLLWRISP